MVNIRYTKRYQIEDHKFDKWAYKMGLDRAVAKQYIKDKFTEITKEFLKQEGLKWKIKNTMQN